MARLEKVSIDVSDISLLTPDGAELSLGDLPGLQVVVVMRHRHCLPCQAHLVQVQQALQSPWVGLLVVGFSPPDRLAAITRYLGFEGMVLSDPARHLYRRLGLGRAPWWRIYTPATLAIYARALRRGQRLHRPQEDTRQLGGDAVLFAGRITALWRSSSPDDRPSAAEVMDVAAATGEAQR